MATVLNYMTRVYSRVISVGVILYHFKVGTRRCYVIFEYGSYTTLYIYFYTLYLYFIYCSITTRDIAAHVLRLKHKDIENSWTWVKIGWLIRSDGHWNIMPLSVCPLARDRRNHYTCMYHMSHAMTYIAGKFPSQLLIWVV